MGIKTKLTFLFILTSLIPMVFLGVFVFYVSKNSLTKVTLNQLNTAATQLERRVESSLQVKVDQLKLFTSQSEVRQHVVNYLDTGSTLDQTILTTSVAEAKNSLPDLQRITIYSPSGTVIASTDKNLIDTDKSTNQGFQKGKNIFTSPEIFPNADHTLSLRNYGPLVLNGELIGVAEFTTSAKEVTAITSDYAGLGETGDPNMVERTSNGDAISITPLRFKPDAAFVVTVPKTNVNRPAIQALMQHETTYKNLTDYRGHKILAATRYIKATGWGLVVKIDQAEAYRPINSLRNIFLAFTLFLALLVVILIVELTRSVTQPILRVSEATRRISKGKLNTRVKVQSNDEIGLLSMSVNHMAEQLGAAQGNLEAKVAERTARLRAITNSANDAIISADDNGAIISWNEGARHLFGYTEKQAIGKALKIIMPERFQAMHQAGLERVAAGGKSKIIGKSLELIGCHKKRGEFPIELSLSTWRAEGKRYFTGVIRDITSRKESEHRIAELANIIESTTDAVYVKNLDGVITSWNKGAERLYGYTATEIIGKPITKLLPPENKQERDQVQSRVKNPVNVPSYESVRIKKDGTRFEASITVTPVRNATGEMVGGATIARDVTERKEHEIHAAELATIINTTSDAIITIGIDGNVLNWNPGATELFGYTEEEMIGRLPSVFSLAGEGDNNEDFRKRLFSGKPVVMDTQTRKKSGELIDVSLDMSPVKDDTGEVVAVSLIGRDVSEQQELQRRQRDFVSIASHELRTPLTALVGYLSMVNLAGPADHAKRFIERAGAAAHRLSSLVEDLLSVARIEEERVFLNPAPLQVREVLEEIIPNFQKAAQAKNIRLVLENKLSDKDVIKTDRGKLDQILINLIDNAIKYTHPDGSVQVKATSTRQTVTIKITDTGIGIQKENLDRIFDRFYREYTELSVSAGGTGLGLFITKKLVERQDGTLKITSPKGKGTIATLHFPRVTTAE